MFSIGNCYKNQAVIYSKEQSSWQYTVNHNTRRSLHALALSDGRMEIVWQCRNASKRDAVKAENGLHKQLLALSLRKRSAVLHVKTTRSRHELEPTIRKVHIQPHHFHSEPAELWQLDIEDFSSAMKKPSVLQFWRTEKASGMRGETSSRPVALTQHDLTQELGNKISKFILTR